MTLFFLFSKDNRNPIDQYLATWGKVHYGNIVPVSYESLVKKNHFPKGIYLFADIELLTEQQRFKLTSLWDALNDKGYKLINHPTRSLRRYDLLKSLYNDGVNPFNVYRLPEDYSAIRFPVFLRKANDHRGPQSELIPDMTQLEREIRHLQSMGENLEDWILTEFCDTVDENGYYCKYAAFFLNGKVIPNHLYYSRDWGIKHKNAEFNEKFIEYEMNYLLTNPHQAVLSEVFRKVKIEYGRVDYSIQDGKVCVWEINTNPMIITIGDMTDLQRRRENQYFNRLMTDALKGLYAQGDNCPVYCYWTDRLRSAGMFIYECWRLARLKG